MSPGDKVLFYEARSKSPAVRALGSVVSAPFADPTQFDVKSKYFDKRSSKDKPKWFSVKILFENELFIPRQKLLLALQKNKFIKQSRLSILPLTRSEFLKVLSQSSDEE
jgi:predicted RNA-binding protein with PUA-like domain